MSMLLCGVVIFDLAVNKARVSEASQDLGSIEDRIAKAREEFELYKKAIGIATPNGLAGILGGLVRSSGEESNRVAEIFPQIMNKGISLLNKIDFTTACDGNGPILTGDEIIIYGNFSGLVTQHVSVFTEEGVPFKEKISSFLKFMPEHRVNPNKAMKPLMNVIGKIINSEKFAAIAQENEDEFNELGRLSKEFKNVFPNFSEIGNKLKAKK